MTDLHAAASTSHFVEVNGVKLHDLDYGTAGRRPMLCVHGGAAHAQLAARRSAAIVHELTTVGGVPAIRVTFGELREASGASDKAVTLQLELEVAK